MMSAKEELHLLVDQLGEERVPVAIAYLRQMLDRKGAAFTPATAALARRMPSQAVAGDAFLARPPRDLVELAAEQGVPPVYEFDDLLGDFWPEDETADEFVAAVRRWRTEGGYA